MSALEGHRERLRQRFRQDPASLSQTEVLELALTYALPRRDVAPIAAGLLSRFASLEGILDAPDHELLQIDGIAEYAITYLRLLGYLLKGAPAPVTGKPKPPSAQINLFDLESETEAVPAKKTAQRPKERKLRVFANDEIANTLALLPKAAQCATLDDFKQFLNDRLPYNAAKTRQRRANTIVERFFSDGSLDVPLTEYLKQYSAPADLKPVVFYHLLKAEPLVAKVAEELVWPALPVGRLDREQVREFVLRYLPEASASSQANILRGLFYAYDLLAIGSVNDATLRFQYHSGTLESFLYILTAEFSSPGTVSFDTLFASPLHRWLLWDRDWMRRQLYNLQDIGILTRIAEIDSMRQFTLALDQRAALQSFFDDPGRKLRALREQADPPQTNPEGAS
jgi:DNA repair protein RadC